ncbi:MAG: flagellar basal body protein FliL [Thermotogae bacterium]|nr:MAG: flagellar basal body protein FliL [Thermotogota bacterium]
MADEKKKGRFGSLIIMIVVPAAVAFGVTFAVLQLLGNNVQGAQESQPMVQNEIKAILIQPGTYQTFMLKGGKDVVVIDSLSFKVASDSCRAAIAEKNDEIMDGLMLIFLSKERSELNTASGIELLKKQIRAMVNEIIGFTGDREKYGVIGVFLYIKAISTVE